MIQYVGLLEAVEDGQAFVCEVLQN